MYSVSMFSECVIICSFDVNSFHSCVKGYNHIHEKRKKKRVKFSLSTL